MEDLAGLDRLDGWLNAQREKRHLLLLWLDAYPFAYIASVGLWAWWAFEPDAGLTILAAVAVAVPVAVPLVFVGSGVHAMRTRAQSRKPVKVWPRLSWRRIAAGFLLGVFAALQCVVFADLWHWRQQSAHLLTWYSVVIGAVYFGLLLAEDRYAKQVARRRAARQAHAPVGID